MTCIEQVCSGLGKHLAQRAYRCLAFGQGKRKGHVYQVKPSENGSYSALRQIAGCGGQDILDTMMGASAEHDHFVR